jgi:hypothetical protein
MGEIPRLPGEGSSGRFADLAPHSANEGTSKMKERAVSECFSWRLRRSALADQATLAVLIRRLSAGGR